MVQFVIHQKKFGEFLKEKTYALKRKERIKEKNNKPPHGFDIYRCKKTSKIIGKYSQNSVSL